MNKTTIVFLVILVIAVIAMAYMLFQNNKKWQEQDEINKALIKKFPDLPIVEVKSVTTEEEEEVEKEEVKTEEKKVTEKIATPEEINNFAQKIAGLKTPVKYSEDEQQFYDNNKEAIEATLKNIRAEEQKQRDAEYLNKKTTDAIALINLSWEELKTKTKLKNHIAKLDAVIEEKIVVDEKVLTAVNQKKVYSNEALKALENPPDGSKNGKEGELALTTDSGEEGK